MDCPWCGSKDTTQEIVDTYIQDGKLIKLFKHVCKKCGEIWNSED